METRSAGQKVSVGSHGGLQVTRILQSALYSDILNFLEPGAFGTVIKRMGFDREDNSVSDVLGNVGSGSKCDGNEAHFGIGRLLRRGYFQVPIHGADFLGESGIRHATFQAWRQLSADQTGPQEALKQGQKDEPQVQRATHRGDITTKLATGKVTRGRSEEIQKVKEVKEIKDVKERGREECQRGEWWRSIVGAGSAR